MIGHMLLGSGGGAAVGVLILFLVGLSFYLIPTIVGVIRKVPNIGSIVVINLLRGLDARWMGRRARHGRSQCSRVVAPERRPTRWEDPAR
jgi:hypothetical protein